MKLICALTAIISLACSAQAGPNRAALTFGSRHIGASGFNQFNPGLFLTWENPRVHWSVGIYHNSYNHASVAVAGYAPLVYWRDGNAGLFAGLAHYPVNGRDFSTHLARNILAIGGVQIRHGNLFIQITPMNGKPVKALLSFGVTWPLAR